MRPEIYLMLMGVPCIVTAVISYRVNRDKAREELSRAIADDIPVEQMQKAEDQISVFYQENNLASGESVDRSVEQPKVLSEQEADYIAGALLMPLEDVYQYLTENHYKEISPRQRVKMAHKLRRRYGVSSVIAVRRIREVYMLKEYKK